MTREASSSLQPRLADIASSYGAFIIDLWGVIHDGQRPYVEALDALDRLRACGAPVCFLSNAPRRTADLAGRLRDMGIAPGRYDHLVSSGEIMVEALREPPDAWHRALGRRYLHLGPPDGFGILAALPQVRVDTPEAADFVLATGTSAGETADDYTAILAGCARCWLPMLCANPDLTVRVGDRFAVCAGTLARRYERLGGEVRYYGKPYLPVYRRCFERLGLDPRVILAIGDGIHTDVAGAIAAGIDVAFVTSGIHRDELGTARSRMPSPGRLAAFLAASGQQPTFVIPGLIW